MAIPENPKTNTNRHLTPQQLATRWSFCLETTRRKLRSGEIPALKLGRSWRIPLAVVEDYERRCVISSPDPSKN